MALQARKLWLPFHAGCVLALFSSSLQAQINISKYQPINQAAEHFFFDRFADAIAVLQPFLDSTVVEQPEYVLACELLAFSFYSLQDAKATEAIREILSRNIHTEADTNLFKPEYVKFFRFEKARLVGRGRIGSNPSGANVFINDRFAGKAPIDTLLLAGAYEIRVESEGYRRIRRSFLIQGGSGIDFVFELSRKSRNWRLYAIGGAGLLTGATVAFLGRGSEEGPAAPTLLGEPPALPPPPNRN
jgi:hypothetical protein